MGVFAGRFSLPLMLSAVVQLGLFDPVEAAGSWKAQVVSAETKQPLEGVIVLAWWTKHVRSFGGPSEEYRDSQEVLTGNDGRVTIAPRFFFTLNPLVFFRGPFLVLFKSGYGYWGSQVWPKDRHVVLAMLRLESLQQRRHYLGLVEMPMFVVPSERRPLLENAIVEERRALGY